MNGKTIIIGAGIAGVAGIAAAHFKRKSAECPDNNEIFCPEGSDRVESITALNAVPAGSNVPFTGFNYALDGQ